MGASVWVGGDLSVPHSGHKMFLQVQQVACIFFRFLSEFIEILLKIFNFVAKCHEGAVRPEIREPVADVVLADIAAMVDFETDAI